MLDKMWIISMLLLSKISFTTTQTCTDGDIRLVSCTRHKEDFDTDNQGFGFYNCSELKALHS